MVEMKFAVDLHPFFQSFPLFSVSLCLCGESFESDFNDPTKEPDVIPICQHCHASNVNRPRLLCWGCYYAPGVRDRYPSTSKYARRGIGNFNGNAPQACEPTTAAPGTREKLDVMAERARMRQRLWHPYDAAFDGDPKPLLAYGEESREQKVA